MPSNEHSLGWLSFENLVDTCSSGDFPIILLRFDVWCIYLNINVGWLIGRNKKRCIWLRGDTTEDEDDFADYDNQTTVGDVDTSESVMVDGKLFKMSPGKAFLSIPDVDRLQINSVNSFLVNRNQGRI